MDIICSHAWFTYITHGRLHGTGWGICRWGDDLQERSNVINRASFNIPWRVQSTACRIEICTFNWLKSVNYIRWLEVNWLKRRPSVCYNITPSICLIYRLYSEVSNYQLHYHCGEGRIISLSEKLLYCYSKLSRIFYNTIEGSY